MERKNRTVKTTCEKCGVTIYGDINGPFNYCDCGKNKANRALSIEAKYNELLMCVSEKWPGETRHETCLRYLKDYDTACDEIYSESEEK